MTKTRLENTAIPEPVKAPAKKIDRAGFAAFRAAEGITAFSTAAAQYAVEENGLVWLPCVTTADKELIDRMLGVSIFPL